MLVGNNYSVSNKTLWSQDHNESSIMRKQKKIQDCIMKYILIVQTQSLTDAHYTYCFMCSENGWRRSLLFCSISCLECTNTWTALLSLLHQISNNKMIGRLFGRQLPVWVSMTRVGVARHSWQPENDSPVWQQLSLFCFLSPLLLLFFVLSHLHTCAWANTLT